MNCGSSVEMQKSISQSSEVDLLQEPVDTTIIIGAERINVYLPILKASNGVALVVNQTSTIHQTHLVDSLLKLGVPIHTIFAPEHGFRGKADAGEQVKDGIDKKTGLPIISLYGKNKKPSSTQLEGIDWVVFDIQDVGARFYTYISTMHYVMEACAEQGISFMVLDRPNPNGHYIDGPVLDIKFRSFVGMHPVPVVHGMTVGEYAQMINGEGWLKNAEKVDLKVIPCEYYSHQKAYELPIPPSPNLPNMRSIYLYPSLCFFEGTEMSVGRGTNQQFQIYGHPDAVTGTYTFSPVSMPGAKYPKHEGKVCQGYNLTNRDAVVYRQHGVLNLNYLIDAYQHFPTETSFFLENKFFDKLAGNDKLRKQIIAGESAEAIRASWQEELSTFRKIRQQYLIYD